MAIPSLMMLFLHSVLSRLTTNLSTMTGSHKNLCSWDLNPRPQGLSNYLSNYLRNYLRNYLSNYLNTHLGNYLSNLLSNFLSNSACCFTMNATQIENLKAFLQELTCKSQKYFVNAFEIRSQTIVTHLRWCQHLLSLMFASLRQKQLQQVFQERFLASIKTITSGAT